MGAAAEAKSSKIISKLGFRPRHFCEKKFVFNLIFTRLYCLPTESLFLDKWQAIKAIPYGRWARVHFDISPRRYLSELD